MFKVKKLEKLVDFDFKENVNGYSKKVVGCNYDFLDIDLRGKVVKKVTFVQNKFVYKNAEAKDIPDLIKNKIVKEIKSDS